MEKVLPAREHRGDYDVAFTGNVAGNAPATTTEFVAAPGPRRLLFGTVPTIPLIVFCIEIALTKPANHSFPQLLLSTGLRRYHSLYV